MTVELSSIALILLLLQIPATAILLSRLFKGLTRRPSLQPQAATGEMLGQVSVVVPTLNEAERLSPCLEGLTRQSYEVREILVVDSHSVDGTQEMVKSAAQNDPRFRLITDDPLPPGWVGRPWALHTGFLQSSSKSEWILGIDADTQPHPGLTASLLHTATEAGYDLISLSSQFILKSPGELWLQPALLITLVYRYGPPDITPSSPERVMANGQGFLCRRSILEELNGYTTAKGSFCDDVTLARNIAAKGYKVGFLDGANVLKVRMYDGFWDTWEGWGRSLDLKDASSKGQLWGDLLLLLAVQGLPLPLLLILLSLIGLFQIPMSLFLSVLLGLNGFLVLIRIALCAAIAPSYDLKTASMPWVFWLSPFADSLAVTRLFLSATRKPQTWRGRIYG
ncbi:MAG: 2'-O-glycosyltransferase CruG [Microcoleaceae cyanobacterium]